MMVVAPSKLSPGKGIVKLQFISPLSQVLSKLAYQYPLKLLSPYPTILPVNGRAVHAIFLLNYGGGLVAGDSIDLEITLTRNTRLILLTQGSTKVFKAPNEHLISFQSIKVYMGKGSALFHLPEPVQPFAESSYDQHQIFELETDHDMFFKTGTDGASLFVCDWTSDGRPARNEHWDLRKYMSKLEVWAISPTSRRKIILRDNTMLEAHTSQNDMIDFRNRVGKFGIFGTLLICGPLFVSLGKFFVNEFASLRETKVEEHDHLSDRTSGKKCESERKRICGEENHNGIIWTTSTLRGVVVVKFGANSVESAKTWMRAMLLSDGTVEREFGERSMTSLI